MSRLLRRASRSGSNRAGAGGGFSLIELLVVVSIIALLVAILLPGLSRAKELTRRSICAGNLHHIYTSMHMYLYDSLSLPPLTRSPDIVVPPEGSKGLTNDQLRKTPWDLFPVIYHADNKGPETSEYTNFGKLVEGGFIDSVELLYCPSQTSSEFQFQTRLNPWPPDEPEPIDAYFKRWNHVFSSYGRRLGLSNISFDTAKQNTAIVTDVAMFPAYVQTHHWNEGFNVLDVSGGVKFNSDPWYRTEFDDYEDYDFYDAIRHCIDVFSRLDED